MYAFLVEGKGVCDVKIVKRIAQWIDSLGYKRIIIKSDREPSIVSVEAEVPDRADMLSCIPEPPDPVVKPRRLYVKRADIDIWVYPGMPRLQRYGKEGNSSNLRRCVPQANRRPVVSEPSWSRQG